MRKACQAAIVTLPTINVALAGPSFYDGPLGLDLIASYYTKRTLFSQGSARPPFASLGK